MNGLLVWAYSLCRSTAFLYKELAAVFDVPLKISVANYGADNRTKLGFKFSEFDGLDYVLTGNDPAKALGIYESHQDYHQIFATYHTPGIDHAVYRRAVAENRRVAVFSEAPINMESSPHRVVLKNLYNRHILPRRVSRHVTTSPFFVNYSGNTTQELLRLGWSREKIIEFGYFPPPPPDFACRQRSAQDRQPLKILCSGIISENRGTETLVMAVKRLCAEGIAVEATITQDGPLRARLERFCTSNNLPVRFAGMLPIDQLGSLYLDASVFVATGLNEPWGIRVNDALNCGCPVIVSSGMGGLRLAETLDCGLVYGRGNVSDLAAKLRSLSTDPALYARLATNAFHSRDRISPQSAARQLADTIKSRFPQWLGQPGV